MDEVFITGVGKFLPGEPVTNDAMESIIGRTGGCSSIGASVLRKNGIRQRHYALIPNGDYSHTNAEMAANAILDALADAKCQPEKLDLLATSTTQGDYLVPGFASAVHGELSIPPLELASFQSVCASSLMAIKTAWLSVGVGESELAVASGSEFASRWFRPGYYKSFNDANGGPDPGMEFLRWTLSDGAGALALERMPRDDRVSLRVDWIQQRSFADRFPLCMYAGAAGNTRPADQPWNLYPSPNAAYEAGALVLKQDFDLLYRMFSVWAGYYLELVDRFRIDPDRIDYFLPHYSARSLGDEIKKILLKTGAMIPENRWRNNLEQYGNTGTASIFIMLEELIRTEELRPGQRILCFVPESGRCIASFMHFTAV